MVDVQIRGRDVRDTKLLQALRSVPRHLFVSERSRADAYRDRPLSIGEGQTISQPYIVAKMTELARIAEGEKVLEVGTGSGYQAAVLLELGATVYSIEIVDKLAVRAQSNLRSAGYDKNFHARTGDGYHGWSEAAPFDAIIVTAAPEVVPQPLKDQLAIGGRLVIPVGGAAGPFRHQQLLVFTKTEKGLAREAVLAVAFVPMTGIAQKNDNN